MKIFQKINWTNTVFLLVTPLIALVGAVFLIANGRIYGLTLALGLLWMAMTGLAITAGYHRLFAHGSYRAHIGVRLFFLFFGAAAFEGSALEWCTDHRNHHRYTDTEKDPYNIEKGFWYAHIGWLLTLDPRRRDYSNVEDLMQDKWMRLQHRFFAPLAIFGSFILPMLIAALWGDLLGGLLIAGVCRTVLVQHFTFCINSVCHIWGKRNYSREQSGRDHWLTAWVTFGEGFHNFHHQFPLDYRNGVRYYDYDPTKWLIWCLSRVGLAGHLKRIGVVHITRYRLKADEQALFAKLKQRSHDYLEPLRNRILQLLEHIETIEKSQKIKEYRKQLKAAHTELKYYLSEWTRLIKNHRLSDNIS